MLGRARLGFVVVALGGCAAEQRVDAELVELCGQREPVLLLPLDSTVAELHDHGFFGDRRVVEFVGWPDYASQVGRHVWSVGACGESPRELEVDDRGVLLRRDAWPEVVLKCSDLDLSALDPTGQRAPRVISQGPCSASTMMELGLLTFVPGARGSALALQPWPDDPWTDAPDPIVLRDSVSTARVAGQVVFALNPDDEIERIVVQPGSPTPVTVEVIIKDVRSFTVSANARYILRQARDVSAYEGTLVLGPLFLHDLETGDASYIADDHIGDFQLYSEGESGDGFLSHQVDPETIHVYRLPSLDASEVQLPPLEDDLPDATSEAHQIQPGADDYFWVALSPGGLAKYEVATSDFTVLSQVGRPRFGESDDVSVTVWGHDSRNARLEASVSWVSPSGELELVAERAVADEYGLTSDGRGVVIVGLDDHWSGDLLVVERESLEERLIDTKVRELSVRDRTITYLVDDTERAGLWMAKLAP